MKRSRARETLAACLLAALLCSPGWAAEPAADLRPASITVTLDDNYPPYVFRNAVGRLQGIRTEMWELWSRKTGIPVQLDAKDWGKAVAQMEAGQADVIDTIFETDARAHRYDFSSAYATIGVPIYFDKSISGLSDTASLSGFTIGVKEGDACIAWLTDRGVGPFRRYPSYETLIAAAGAKEVRVLCIDAPPADYFLARQGLSSAFRSTAPLYSGQFHWAVKKGQRALHRIVSAGFAQISGAERQAIDDRWIGHPAGGGHFAAYAGYALVLATGLGVALVLWNWSLRRRDLVRSAQLISSEERFYRLLFDKNPLPMWVIEPETLRFLSVNDAAILHYGYTRTEFLTMTVQDIRPPEDVATFQAAIRQRPLAGYRRTDVSRHRKKDGTLILVESTGDDAVLNGRPVRLIALNDVTDRQRAEAALDREREATLMREKLAAMGTLLAGVAHELNNPLSVVIGNAELMQAEVKGSPLAQRGDRIVAAANRCVRIVKNFLALARHQPHQVETVRLNAILRETAELVAYTLRVDGVAVEYDLASDIPAVWGDRHELGQVVINLVLNAQQAMHETPQPRRLILGSRYDPERGRVELRVTDTGPGVPPAIQQRIFEPLFTTKPTGQGTGLGLSICTAIVERHGGSLRVESEPGHGATFSLDLPIGEAPVSLAVTGSESVAVVAATVLVVDDEPDVGALIREILSEAGHEVDLAANGVQALERLRGHAYDVIISDMRMPELDGPGLYRAVQEWRPALCPRFVFMTGDSLGPETVAFLETVGPNTLPKPFLAQEIRTAVERVLVTAQEQALQSRAGTVRAAAGPVPSI